jgi:RimJ/RimL family protein N-acetyltransferase
MAMELAGRLCTLRPWRREDIPALARSANNWNIARNLRDRFPHPYTERDARAFVHASLSARPPLSFAIVVGGEAGGGIGISPGSDVERFSAEVGYWLAEPLWGRGITSEALTLVSEYAFRECNLLRLFALPFADNVSSIRVLEKAGYVREGVLRASAVKEGVARDQALFARVNPAWSMP